jgi:hypothetical protein
VTEPDEKIKYYRLKVGPGDLYCELCKKLKEEGKLGGFYIGWKKRQISDIDKDGKVKNTKPRDLKNLVKATNLYRDSSRVITYSSSCMTYWEITGPLRYTTEEEKEAFKQEIKSNKEKYHKIISHDLDWKKELLGEGDSDELYPKILPVKHLLDIERHELLPTVNSLSVHQWLNRGTFRNYSSIGRTTDSAFDWPKGFLEIKDTEDNETNFGCFVRRYLDYLYDKKNNKLSGNEIEDYMNVNSDEVAELFWKTLNPSQVETLGALLAIDLGFCLEIGPAKALDVIDIQAKIPRDDINGEEKIEDAISDLNKLGCDLSENIKKCISSNMVLKIQCKADNSQPDLPDDVILLKPIRDNSGSKNVLSVQQIADNIKATVDTPSDSKNVKGWISLMRERVSL